MIIGELSSIVLLIVMGYIIKIISDNSVRKGLIDKGLVDENLKCLFSENHTTSPSELKWGMILTAAGLFVLINF